MMHSQILKGILIGIVAFHLLGNITFGQSQLVKVNGIHINAETYGIENRVQGEPVVIFENASLATLESWDNVFYELGKLTPVVRYDRSGVGKSEWDGRVSSTINIADRLRALLSELDIDPPYILVGHSWGAQLARRFAHRFRDRTAGLVLVDPGYKASTMKMGLKDIGYPPEQGLQEYIDDLRNPKNHSNLTEGEKAELKTLANWFADPLIPEIPNIPIAGLLAGKPGPAPPGTENLPYDFMKWWRATYSHERERMINLTLHSPDGIFIQVDQSSHFIQNDAPDLVISAIKYVINSDTNFAQNQSENSNSVSFKQLVEKGDSLSSKGKYNSALLAYEEALRIEPDSIKIYNRLTKKYAFLGLFDEAQRRTRELFFENKNLQNLEWLHREGTCLLGAYEALQGNYKSAINFSVILLALKEREDFSNCVYRTYAMAGYESKSIEQLEKLLEKKPNNPTYIIWLTYLYKQEGNQQRANQLMEQVKKIRSLVESGQLQGYEEVEIQYGLAMIAVLEEDKPKAIKHLRKSYELGNKKYYWWKNFNVIFNELEEYPEYQELLAQIKTDIDKMREEYVQSNSGE